MHTLLINLITLLGLFGFSISSYIYTKKKRKKKMICPMRSNCETVIHSDYSHIVGIPVEILGMLYYAFIGIAYSAVFVLHLWSTPTAEILLGVSACSVIFSIYLVLVQVLVLKQLCAWCLMSAATTFAIFILSYYHAISY